MSTVRPSQNEQEGFQLIAWPLGALMIPISICGFFGNLTLLLAVLQSVQLHNRCCGLMTLLAAADLGTNVYFIAVRIDDGGCAGDAVADVP